MKAEEQGEASGDEMKLSFMATACRAALSCFRLSVLVASENGIMENPRT
jgi:hypothetical protein